MFLNKLICRNKKLVQTAFQMHKDGSILPDTYILDLDSIIYNAKMMKREADKYGIDLYFMLKQIGRNPIVAKSLIDLGYKGAVTVDYKEALCMIDNGIHISNVGHLVQIPNSLLDKIISAKPDYVTVYSYEKILSINEVCKKHNIIQKLLIRLSDEDSKLYSGQVGGFNSNELLDLINKINKLDNVEFAGLTVFPALLYDEILNKIVPTENINALNRGIKICEDLGLNNLNINIPSATCISSIPLISKLKGTSGEPGHGLTGTTPLHKYSDEIEVPAYVYVSEISHCFDGKSYCYAGGHYRRSHMENVLVGNTIENAKVFKVYAPSDEAIDYHFEIEDIHEIGTCALMAYRTQIFTTRSYVAVVSGIQEDNPKLLGIYNSIGQKI